MAQNIAKRIVQEDGEEDKRSACEEAAALGSGDTAHNAGQSDDGEAGHNLADFRIGFLIAPLAVAECTDGHRQDGDKKDTAEHADSIHIDAFARQPEHEQGRHERSEQGGYGGHAYGVGNIAPAEKAHDVAGDATGAAAYQNETGGDTSR